VGVAGIGCFHVLPCIMHMSVISMLVGIQSIGFECIGMFVGKQICHTHSQYECRIHGSICPLAGGVCCGGMTVEISQCFIP